MIKSVTMKCQGLNRKECDHTRNALLKFLEFMIRCNKKKRSIDREREEKSRQSDRKNTNDSS